MTEAADKRALDVRLVERCVAGDTDAWAELVGRYEPTVYFALQKVLRLHHVAPSRDRLEDLTAEVFFRLVRNDFAKLKLFEGRSSLASWLQVIAGNYAIDSLRKRRPSISLDDPKFEGLKHNLPDDTPPLDEVLGRRESAALLRRLWRHLRPVDRRFVQLYYQSEMSFDEVAQEMGTTVGAVYGRKNRVRKKLERLLRRHEIPSKLRR